jgi:flagellar basal body-associated protein FliL
MEVSMKIRYFIPILLIVLIFSFGFVGCCFGSSSSTPTTESEQSKQIEAFVRSQTAVEKQLKAPSTAKFPYYSDDGVIVTKLATGKYQVNAYVDSENSFGAMVRATYSVTIISTGEDTYSWEDLQIYE